MTASVYSDKLSKSKFRNWLKAGLGVLFTKEGITPFVYDEIEQFQQKCLSDICNNNGLPAGTTCSGCCTENIVVCPTNKICSIGRGRCTFHRDYATQYIPSGCPGKICHNFKNEIQKAHRYYGPSYHNTDATQWCSNPWEVAKCFMPPDGYKDAVSATETDFNGINSVIINFKDIQSKVHADLSKTNNIFNQGRDVGKEVRHSPDLEVEDTDLQTYFTVLQNVLSDPAYLAANTAAQNAKQKLSQILNDTLVIGKDDILKVLDDAAKVAQDKIRNEKDEYIKDAEKQKLKLIKITDSSINKIEKQEQFSMSELDKALKSAVDEIEKQKNESVRQLQSETTKNLKRITTEGDTVTEKAIKKIQLESDAASKTNAEEKYKKQKDVYTYFAPGGAYRLSPLVSVSVAGRDDGHSQNPPLFTSGIGTGKCGDKSCNLDKSPRKLDLDTSCKTYGICSDEVQTKCRQICDNLKHSSKNILNVWPAHRENNEHNIIFVIITNTFVNELKDIGLTEDFDVLLRADLETNAENSVVIDHEVETETRIDIFQIEKLQEAIAYNFPILIKEHSNITMISASPFKSTGFQNGEHIMEREDCIVIFVHVKGLIPIKETVFPKSLGGFTVDVREAKFNQYVGGNPSDRHDLLKMGCAIGPSKRVCTGTLGGFIEHEKHGLCAFTCAHVLIEESDMNSETPRKIECVQPSLEYKNSKPFGTLVCHAIGNSPTGQGVDVALIKLDKDERSICCDFPDFSKEDLKIAGFDEDHTLRYSSGEVYTSGEIAKYRDSRLIKYGASSLLKRGVFGFKGALIANNSLGPYFGRYDIIIQNLIQINDIAKCGKFATEGDSGALVFSVSDKGLVAIGLLIGGWKGCSYAAPICDILQAVNVSSPFTLKSFSEANGEIL